MRGGRRAESKEIKYRGLDDQRLQRANSCIKQPKERAEIKNKICSQIIFKLRPDQAN